MWSIGIYAGKSPFSLESAPGVVNPVLTSDSVTDVSAKFVADPFMIKVGGVWHMFFEVLNERTQRGEIGLATSDDGLSWSYRQIVLTEDFHLSYPNVFEWNHEYFMIPETLQPETVRLYKADDFPFRWTFVGSILNAGYADPSIFRFGEKWWMFACSTPFQHDALRLYSSDRLMGPWSQHPANPIIEGDKRNARPAGRVLVFDNKIIRFAQDCATRYGHSVRAFEIHQLTADSYVEQEHPDNPILKASGAGWNELGMHHIDAHQLSPSEWIACVDGLDAAE